MSPRFTDTEGEHFHLQDLLPIADDLQWLGEIARKDLHHHGVAKFNDVIKL